MVVTQADVDELVRITDSIFTDLANRDIARELQRKKDAQLNAIFLEEEKRRRDEEDCVMRTLVGKRILAIMMQRESGDEYNAQDGEQRIVFITNEGPIAFETYGDCCSTSWFSDIVGYGHLINQTVNRATCIELSDPTDERSRTESDKQYGVELYTDLGVATIAYRNASNGYYGGWCSASDDVSITDCYAITGDWSS